MLLLATDMDMLLPTTDNNNMGKDMDNNKFANTQDHPLLLGGWGELSKLRLDQRFFFKPGKQFHFIF
jgi:hypothetical protein